MKSIQGGWGGVAVRRVQVWVGWVLMACASSAWTDEGGWATPWTWDGGKLPATVEGNQVLNGDFVGQEKGAFVERVIPADVVLASDGNLTVELEMEVLALEGNDQKLQIQIKPPGETAYREDDPGYLQIRWLSGKPTAFATLRGAEGPKWDSQNLSAAAVGTRFTIAFQLNLKDGTSRMDVASGEKKFTLSRQVAPQWETCASKGLVLRIKPQSGPGQMVKLRIKGTLPALSTSPAE